MPLSDTITAEWAWVIPALSVSAFFITATFGRFLPRQGLYVPIAAIGVGFILFWFVFADLVSQRGANGRYRLDRSGRYADILGHYRRPTVGDDARPSLPLSRSSIQVYSIEYMKGEGRIGWYYAVHALFAGAMLTLVLADNLIFLYLAWELVGLGLVPSHRLLVGAEIGRGGQRRRPSSPRESVTWVC